MLKYQLANEEFALLEASPVPMAVYQFLDQRVVTLALSAGFLKLFCLGDREEAYALMDSDMYRDTHPDDAGRVAEAAYRFAAEDVPYNVTYRSRAAEGSYHIIHAQGEHHWTETGERLATVWYTDEGVYDPDACGDRIDLNRSLNSALRQESLYRGDHYDGLTGMPNMTYFFRLAECGRKKMLSEGRKPAFLFIDLNGMKHFNGKYGFAEGDRLLKAFSRLLISYFSNENCCRFAQDHFGVYTEEADLEARLEALFEECKEINGGRSLPVRVGIYLDEEGLTDISTACDRARAACETDRSAYISYYKYFDKSMLAAMKKRQYIIDNLDRAIAERWIRIYFQPIIRAANDRVCNEEVLSRWVDPERGLLAPLDFIPVLEDTRLVYKLDLYVVDQILEKMKQQKEFGMHLVPKSVNLSRSDFDSCDVVEEIRRRVDASGVGRDKLIIEVTESMVGSDFEFMKEQINRFRALGFRVWMDDFGSGYSSLDVLQSIRFDLIKFDMSFMKKFDQGEESRIILTELIKMAIGLGVDTLCEGVETEAQVAFLKEVGCNKLQGFYYCKPISLEQVVERYRTGVQIGFENPDEADYYSAIGGVNLYDLAAIANEERDSFRRYFDTIPMAIIESAGESFVITRCNRSYRAFMKRVFGINAVGSQVNYPMLEGRDGAEFLLAVRKCAEEGGRMVVDEELRDGSTTHAMIRRIAENPVSGSKAVAVAVLTVVDPNKQGDGVSFARIARTLAADYFNLFYVDLETEQFIEYTSNGLYGTMAMERHGDDFFRNSREDARKLLYEEDQEGFVQAFTKENVVRSMDKNGAFTHTYRLKMEGDPIYVNMKAVRIQGEPTHMIIGVSSIDAQMRERKELERVSEESIIYARVAALVGDYFAIYTVDPDTGRYVEYSAQGKYLSLQLPKKGQDFYKESRMRIRSRIHPTDLEGFLERFTRENIMKEIRESGSFRIGYRLLLEGKPTPVKLKAVIVEEKEGPRMIVGVNFVEE